MEKRSNTGTYRIVEGRLVKVSSDVPKIASRIEGVYFRSPYYETFNGREPVWIESKGQKKAEMKARGIAEYNDFFKAPEPVDKVGTIYSYTGQPARVNKESKKRPMTEKVRKSIEQKSKFSRP